MQRLLLILPSATYRAPDFMGAARELGVAVTVASDRAAAMSAAMGERALTLRSSDPREAAEVIIARAHDTPFAAIVGVDDQGVMTAALAAERLGLPHNPPLAVARTRDKAAMRRAFAEANVPQPRFVVLAADVDVPTAARETGLPCVIKPLSLSGSRGVIRADDPEQARAAAERVRGILASAGEPADAPLLLESYLPGAEVAVEGLLRSGGCRCWPSSTSPTRSRALTSRRPAAHPYGSRCRGEHAMPNEAYKTWLDAMPIDDVRRKIERLEHKLSDLRVVERLYAERQPGPETVQLTGQETSPEPTDAEASSEPAVEEASPESGSQPT